MRDFLQCIKYIRLALIVISSFILPIHSYAQGVYFKQLSVHNGLSQNDVSSIVQDSYGFIWIGTYDGLNRFDGIKVESFRKMTANLESLPDNRITALEEDDKK
ncbi:MAG TPA: two-component regulator propeller domain-containing protein, partial [Saprospiraceae bacterium]|nr:two-component regulator propeller domain-containing protein [Saprospiraceae bacterium]